MRIQNNIMAMTAYRMYSFNSAKMSKSMARLASGFRINSAADDAAGLAISEKMRSQIRGLSAASRNAQDAISAIHVAEGAVAETHSMLQRMKELAVNAATGTLSEFDRLQSAKEYDQLLKEINDIAGQTNFNNMLLLDGSKSIHGPDRSAATAGIYANFDEQNDTTRIDFNMLRLESGDNISIEIDGTEYKYTWKRDDTLTGLFDGISNQGLNIERDGNSLIVDGEADVSAFEPVKPSDYGSMSIQVGALQGQILNIDIRAMNTKALGLEGSGLFDQDTAGKAITAIDGAIAMVSDQRSTLGAMENRLGHKINNLENTIENLTEAESRIRNTDIAKEMMEFTRCQILTQTATAMLAQANSQAQNVLTLLQ